MYNSTHTWYESTVCYPVHCVYVSLCSTGGVLVEGSTFLQSYGYLQFDIWYNEAALLLMTVLLLILAYINLRLINKRK